tara:strand:- start:379 stop:492 length:114 start_codon:yes stop_codon:yes gene_type:complete
MNPSGSNALPLQRLGQIVYADLGSPEQEDLTTVHLRF